MARIVVGVDGSEIGLRALRWALHEAELRDLPVLAVHAYAGHFSMAERLPTMHVLEPAGIAQAVVDDQIERAKDSRQRVKIETVVADSNPARLLLETALPDDILVVGSRGHGGLASVLLGSTSLYVAGHAESSVVIVR